MAYIVLAAQSALVQGVNGPATRVQPFHAFTQAYHLLDLEALGGYHANGGKAQNLSIKVNETSFGTYQLNRWTDHGVIVPDRRLIVIPPAALRLFPVLNFITFQVVSNLANDYLFIGPMVLHTP